MYEPSRIIFFLDLLIFAIVPNDISNSIPRL
jgi:hypothetical protein